jgi:hypothetical protein
MPIPYRSTPDAAELSHAELLCDAAQLSNPTIQIKFPFPFVGNSIPERFNSSLLVLNST